MDRQAGLMAEAVINLLELARLEHHPTLRLETVPTSELLRHAASAVTRPPDAEPDRTHLDADPHLEVRCDRRLMTRVLSNLVHNAYRHNPAGVEVSLSATTCDGEVVLKCSDTGDGVPPELRDRLFDEFTSSDETTIGSPSYGLGLAFCKAAVEAHGGRIRCESTPGDGATFRVLIPITSREEGTHG